MVQAADSHRRLGFLTMGRVENHPVSRSKLGLGLAFPLGLLDIDFNSIPSMGKWGGRIAAVGGRTGLDQRVLTVAGVAWYWVRPNGPPSGSSTSPGLCQPLLAFQPLSSGHPRSCR